MTLIMNAGAAVVVMAVVLVVYAYVLYPAILWLWGRVRPYRAVPGALPAVEWPMISITVPVYNEVHQVRDLLESLVRLDYPAERRQILIVSDASTDGTDAIVAEYAEHGVELLRQGERRGKTAAENATRSALRGEIVINTDASIRIAADAIKPLVSCFGDPTIGLASGRDISVTRVGEQPNVGEAGYVGYEMWVRSLETRVSGIVGASGCFYAIRPHLHRNVLPEALSRDFAAAMVARQNGYRAVSVNDAICYVPRTPSLKGEYRRKVRTMTRGMETLLFLRRLLNPFVYGTFSWMLFSHKICRWLTPWAMLFAMAAIVALSWTNPLAAVPIVGAALLSTLALVGWTWPDNRPMPRIFSVPAFLAAGNIAVLHSTINALRGELNPIWEPTRREAGPSPEREGVVIS